MDIGGLTAFLAPFLPFLVQAGESFGEAAATNVGGGLAKEIWATLRARLAAKPAAQEAVDDVAARPDDERARGALELQIEKLLASDAALREAIAALWARAEPQVIASGERSVAAGEITGSTVITGDHNTSRS